VNPALPPLVAPFRGERYAPARVSAVLAPPYDVIATGDRPRYAARDPHNIVHLIVPEAAAGENRYARAAALLEAWRRDGVLRQDPADAIYVVAQGFALPAGERRTRLGMFAAVAAEPFEAGRVRPHERTHAAPKADRLALLEATRTNLESIFLLAPDADRALAHALGRVAAGPPDVRAGLDDVEIRLWVVAGDAAQRLAALANRAPLYIADGHHRYETAVAYARMHPEANRVLSLVVSATDPGLTILPTHRIIFGTHPDPANLIAAWRQWFDVGRVDPDADWVERLAELGRERTACLVAFPEDHNLSLVLKPDALLDAVPELGKTPAVRALDIARVEALVVGVILGAGTTTPVLGYTAEPDAALAAVRHGGAAAAVLVNPTRVEQVFAVADSGGVMPPKSTYFVPKVPSGLVLLPLENSEGSR
jgi:uncharacterized protein (DUF1015 family)